MRRRPLLVLAAAVALGACSAGASAGQSSAVRDNTTSSVVATTTALLTTTAPVSSSRGSETSAATTAAPATTGTTAPSTIATPAPTTRPKPPATTTTAKPRAGTTAAPARLPGGGTTVVGDSVAYGAASALQARGAVVNTRIGRTFADGPAVISGLIANGSLGRRVIVHLGTTGTVKAATCDQVMALLAGRTVTIVTVYAPGWSDWQTNSSVLRSCAARHGAALRDWATLAAAHDPAWFFSDHRHLKGSAAVQAYTNLILS